METDEQFMRRMDWAARAFARTGAGKCWECGADTPVGAAPLEAEDYAEENPLRLYCRSHIPSPGIRRQQADAVGECLDLAAKAMGIE